jgi:signal transduction histidine kinase
MAHFKARARSVDMLGRQQIAGIPGAISELFKNAHDAYAQQIRIDYLEKEDLFMVRDDGYGMTPEDFENKWLALGTESRLAENYVPMGITEQKKRKILGEKGIGRLSIAVIGPAVLVVTRAKRGDEVSPILSALVCWKFFEIPGLNIEDIPIPLIENDTMPDRSTVESLVNQSIRFFKKLQRTHPVAEELKNDINTILENFSFSPADCCDELKPLTLADHKAGTHFYIKPVNSVLKSMMAAKDNDEDKSELHDLHKQLLGFRPAFLNVKLPDITPRFFIHRQDSLIAHDYIDEREFFSPKDYADMDHHFEGVFDEYGLFRGRVNIYGQDHEYEAPWREGAGRKTECGPFAVRIGFLQGQANESTLDPERFAQLRKKMDILGGLYIYKAGIRVLPYGDNDFDFLKLERDRSKSASYYLFSLRRFIGAVLLDPKKNAGLQEKAGREGFTKNQAYFDFVSLLRGFLYSLLNEFLRDNSNQLKSDVYKKTKERVRRVYDIRRAEEGRVKAEQEKFRKLIDHLFRELRSAKITRRLKELKETILKAVDTSSLFDAGTFETVTGLRNEVLGTVRELEGNLRIDNPRAALGAELSLQYEAYLDAFEKKKQLIAAAAEELLKILDDYLVKINEAQAPEENFRKSVKNYEEEIRVIIAGYKTNLEEALSAAHHRNIDWEHYFTEKYLNKLQVINESVKHPISDSSVIPRAFRRIEELIAEAHEDLDVFYKGIVSELAGLADIDPQKPGTYSSADALIARTEELLELSGRLEDETELFQLGTAVSVIHHEFGMMVNDMRSGIRELKPWADLNEKLQPLYKTLKNSFEHLENYMALFTPLNKRARRSAADISGNEIFKYIKSVFSTRLEADSVDFTQTEGFKQAVLHTYASLVFPVFINITDNALFWLKSKKDDRKIRFHLIDEDMCISDNGPGIKPQYRSLVFERGYTLKPGGRGLGLYISKQVLNGEGFDIDMIDSCFGQGAGFRIFKKDLENG